jgi:hypothetical protein
MFASQLSLASAQLRRSTATEIAESPAPWREAALEAFRRRNAVLDALFYDVGRITDAEAGCISPWLAKEGALLIVPPSGRGPLALCQDVDDFARKGGEAIRALAVAGVGSSALGSAAFARNVADAFDQPVAAVVSGYGLADLVTEAAGGWFWFGTLNRLRHQFEQLDAWVRSDRWRAAGATTTSIAGSASLDTQTVYRLLSDARFRFSLLTGHSKGNLVISEALYALKDRAAVEPDPDTWLVTMSAAIAMPPRYRNVVDVMGQIDWFGGINSRPSHAIEVRVPLAWHHTNTELWFSLPVHQVFRDLMQTRGVALEPD